jgi:light-regulated signal transduction histidine kinase (bacteriophytochrome)
VCHAQKSKIKRMKRELENVEANQRHFLYMAQQKRPELLKKISEIAVCKFLSEHNMHEDESSYLPNFDKTI